METLRMSVAHRDNADGWRTELWLHKVPHKPVPWTLFYRPLLGDDVPTAPGLSGVYMLQSDETCYAITHGSAHFFVRPFCDYDFGIDVAKRIANEGDVTQTASKRFQGIRRKEIRSYAANSRLSVQGGESVDFVQAKIMPDYQALFGRSGKFGTSAQLSPKLTVFDVGHFLSSLSVEMRKPERFRVPRTLVIKEPAEVERFDRILVDGIRSPGSTTAFASDSFELSGVEFIFGGSGDISIKAPRKPSVTLDSPSIEELRTYINEHNLTDDQILRINVTHIGDDGSYRTEKLKESLDFTVDAQRVVLTGGKWMQFNQDYLDYLDEVVRGIDTEETESSFKSISMTETGFNASQAVRDAGYINADKDFSIFKTKSSTSIEAWDLQRGDTVYALKFGTAQKLGYVCDQASNLLHLLSNKAGVKRIPQFQRYCLWLGYEAQTAPKNIADTNSIILKQKIEAWARLCTDLGITPVIKISKKVSRRTSPFPKRR